MMDNKDIDYLTEEFDEMSTSDLVMWLENHRDTDETCNKMYWDMEYVCKKWVKEMGESCIEPDKPSDTNFDKQIDTKHISNNHVNVQLPTLSTGKMNRKFKEFLTISILKTE
jgi:hypothetical protein